MRPAADVKGAAVEWLTEASIALQRPYAHISVRRIQKADLCDASKADLRDASTANFCDDVLMMLGTAVTGGLR